MNNPYSEMHGIFGNTINGIISNEHITSNAHNSHLLNISSNPIYNVPNTTNQFETIQFNPRRIEFDRLNEQNSNNTNINNNYQQQATKINGASTATNNNIIQPGFGRNDNNDSDDNGNDKKNHSSSYINVDGIKCDPGESYIEWKNITKKLLKEREHQLMKVRSDVTKKMINKVCI